MASKVYTFPLLGLREVQVNLNKAIAQIVGGTKAGLLEAGFLIQRRAVELAPIDTGNLRGSSYTEPGEIGGNPVVEVGFQAEYSVFVHEIAATHVPPTQWKFLETAVKQSIPDIPAIIQARARVS